MSGGTGTKPKKPKPPNPKVFDPDGTVRLPVDPRTVGLGDTRSGHALAFKECRFNRHYTFVCPVCPNSEFTGQITKSGTAGVHLLEQWRNHLDAADAPPDEIHRIGWFTTKTSTTTLFVTHRGYRDIKAYAGGSDRYAKWVEGRPGWWGSSDWAVVSENHRGPQTDVPRVVRRAVLNLSGSKELAFQKAAQMLRREQTRGYAVTIVADSINNIPESTSAAQALAQLLTEAKVASTPAEILSAMERFDDVLHVVPALQQCRDGLNQAFENALLSTRDRAGSS